MSERETWKREIEFVREVEPAIPTDRFRSACREFGIEIDGAELQTLARYVALLLANNERVNLTAVREVESAWMIHVFDSLTVLSVLGELGDGARIADVGSGGGLPGMVLAAVMPRARFTLIEATGKKVAFLRLAAEVLALDNVDVVQARAEAIGQHVGSRGTFDGVVARAVGPLAVVLELTVPLARTGGVVALTKGARAREEIEEAKEAFHRLCVRQDAVVETPTGRIVVVLKDRETPRMYPRRAGEPKRSPLGVARRS